MFARKLVIFLLIFTSIIVSGCAGHEVEVSQKPLPTGSIDNFERDTQNLVKLFSSKKDKLEPFTQDETNMIKTYLNQYDDNPRLSEDQASTVLDIEILEISYGIYQSYKDSKEDDKIKTSNQSIKNYFNGISRLEK
ncbi:hypothetical protein [Paenibacillus koleovorans]|uniref:hypothetical protein n=1 Tax=Paenibacillus koleovorans TaxID=121608 RepID=UPI000FD6F14E|nr:hypothetical protein [Paenibacillus koleovorans]